jgi:protein-S-isoprenylcysteine O-methyltransferase Ste14
VQKLLPPVLVLILGVAMVLADMLAPLVELIPAPYHQSGFVLISAGIAVAVAARRQFARAKTNIYTFGEPGTLLTGGAFHVSRNPMYLGFALLLLGVAAVLGSLSPLLIAAAFIVITDRWYIAFEERRMNARFGEAYRQYTQQTRRWL